LTEGARKVWQHWLAKIDAKWDALRYIKVLVDLVDRAGKRARIIPATFVMTGDQVEILYAVNRENKENLFF
jgi:hypothetical protein